MAHRMNRVADAPRPTAPGKACDVGGLVWIGAVLRGEAPLEAAAPEPETLVGLQLRTYCLE